MNEEQLQQIEERANAATSGPWWTDKRVIWVIGQMYYNAYVTTDEADIAGLGAEDICHADAKFIAHARADVPALIAEVRSLRAKLDAVPVAELRFWWDPFKGELTNDVIEKAAVTIETWLKAQEVQP